MARQKNIKVEQGCPPLRVGRNNSYHVFIKKRKARLERREAKRDTECTPGYGKYAGWES